MKYHLAEAHQNTFIVFDCLEKTKLTHAFLKNAHQVLTSTMRDDALILTEGTYDNNTLYARMRILGHDGVEGEFCGNGACAIAAYLYTHYPQVHTCYLKTALGVHPLTKLGGDRYSITLGPARFTLNPKFIAWQPPQYKYVEMLEPHLTINKALSDEELYAMGQAMNMRKDIFPLGINVNAWHEIDDGTLFVKTYERGVGRLTKSCGTGSMSCASLYCKQGKVLVHTPGGVLDITLTKDATMLTGMAHVLF